MQNEQAKRVQNEQAKSVQNEQTKRFKRDIMRRHPSHALIEQEKVSQFHLFDLVIKYFPL